MQQTYNFLTDDTKSMLYIQAHYQYTVIAKHEQTMYHTYTHCLRIVCATKTSNSLTQHPFLILGEARQLDTIASPARLKLDFT